MHRRLANATSPENGLQIFIYRPRSPLIQSEKELVNTEHFCTSTTVSAAQSDWLIFSPILGFLPAIHSNILLIKLYKPTTQFTESQSTCV